MEKRLTTSAMLFSIGFIFLLICTVGAFFYGIQIGSDKTEAKYKTDETSASSAASVSPYQQQDLVSFYHTVFLPYREFQNEWFSAMNKLSQGKTNEATSMFKDLAKLAEDKEKEASSVDMQRSPLLGESQVSYIRSLKLFNEAAMKAATSAKTLSFAELKKNVEQEKTYRSASQFALNAQQAYYSAMLKWAATVDTDIPSEYTSPAILELSQWKNFQITVKNKLMADQLMARNKLTVYYPQDLTSRVDDFIQSGQASNMKLHTLTSVVDLLINTEAVRAGDFSLSMSRLYHQALLPQLPFFSAE
ncbi:hypothetical protein BK133_10790 [Paenibacillus sp. FSL H8-0548]|uniref:hypothetical protein n=1 Tax=Paenibacillus sp. FSL H8-0548 TaxID=1920422 RepID=UPI00096D83E3|nr:hypothetical protein [Paenibacillus sp. FSL H8-0548]OMF35193.1 hypothetical protein BK133_10790 [Paenibacillus sp. FSL H8-0548]